MFDFGVLFWDFVVKMVCAGVEVVDIRVFRVQRRNKARRQRRCLERGAQPAGASG